MRAYTLMALLWLVAACDSRPIVMLGTLAPKVHDAGTLAAAGRGADHDDPRDDDSEHRE